MCVVSMVMDHYKDKWNTPKPPIVPFIYPKIPSQDEIDEFRKLLERAREYDKKNNQPHCENDEKKALLKKLASEWGINISFVDEE